MQIHCETQCRDDREPISLILLWWVFLRIASTSFGGFMAMVSVVQNVVVERRKWLNDEDVLNGVSLASVLPGPTAINVVAYIGYRLRGATGASVCVFAAVLPAFIFMVLLSMVYFRWGQVPAVSKAFMGVVPVMTAIIVVAAWRMRRASATTMREGVLVVCSAAAILCFNGVYTTLSVVCMGALAGRLWFGVRAKKQPTPASARGGIGAYSLLRVNVRLFLLAALPAVVTPLPDIAPEPLLAMSGAFAGMSLLMFCGGYVFIPLLQQTVVDGYGWVTQKEFIDAIALGQVTPGPVMISATFIGYKVAGIGGAVAATIGMFAPPAVLITFLAHLLAGARASPNVQAALRGIRATTVGMVFAAAIVIGKSAMPNMVSAALFAIALIMLARSRVEAGWLVLASGVIGLVAY